MMGSTMKSDRFIYLIYNYRLLYYLPMERMKQLTLCIDDGLQWEVVYRAEISHTEEDYQELKSDLEFVREENKKLNIKVASLEWEIKWLNSVIEKLKEENQTLELWLDNKEKVNKSLREELSKLKEKYWDIDY